MKKSLFAVIITTVLFTNPAIANDCQELMKLKVAKPVASTCGSLYTVSVCEGQPDFTKAENVDAGFELHVQDQKLK